MIRPSEPHFMVVEQTCGPPFTRRVRSCVRFAWQLNERVAIDFDVWSADLDDD